MQGCAASSFEGGEGSILEGETDRRERGWRWRAGSSATKARATREERYSLGSIILLPNLDVSRHILVIDTSVLANSNMGRRE
jgi:hypothetical protein